MLVFNINLTLFIMLRDYILCHLLFIGCIQYFSVCYIFFWIELIHA